jgi:hypothetical protein
MGFISGLKGLKGRESVVEIFRDLVSAGNPSNTANQGNHGNTANQGYHGNQTMVTLLTKVIMVTRQW